MLLTSVHYGLFLAAAVGLTWVVPSGRRPAVLLGLSYAFYATFGIAPLAVLLFDTLVAVSAVRVMRNGLPSVRRLAVVAGVVLPLGVIAVDKLLLSTGKAALIPTGSGNDVAIAVGLSFFTFHAISYVVDGYRGDLPPQQGIVAVAAYIAFFPHLLAGPIMRPRQLIPALYSLPTAPPRWMLREGLELLLLGLFAKVALADPLMALISDRLARPGEVSGLTILIAAMAWSIGIYLNVYGYIQIAIGSARLLGIRMVWHTVQPFTRGANVGDMWRRVQQTVMAWFRDYVYRPLRGDSRGGIRRELSTITVFVLIGVWHDLAWEWIVWGAIQGLVIVLERRTGWPSARVPPTARWLRQPLRAAYMAFVLGIVTLIPLSADVGVGDTFGRLVRWAPGPFDSQLMGQFLLAGAGMMLIDWRDHQIQARSGGQDPVTRTRALAWGVMLLGIIVYAGAEAQPIIYSTF